MNLRLQEKYRKIEKNEIRFEEYKMDDAEYAITAFGTVARIAKTVVGMARDEGIKLGLIRPITLWPFPTKLIEKRAKQLKFFFDSELNAGQMLEDVKLAVNGRKPVYFYGKLGGVVPSAEDIYKEFKKHMEGGR